MRTASDAAALRCFLQNVHVDEQVDVRNVLGEHIQPAYLPLRASDRSSANLGTPDDHRFNLLYFRAVPRARSAGYFSALSFIFSATAGPMSIPKRSEMAAR